jgi:SAM-dependent methyltransferase
MDEGTLAYYETHAGDLARRYEGADLSEAHEQMARLFARGARLLELGCGSGRDAAALVARGYDVRGVDASAAMLSRAVSLHPELAGRVGRVLLPARLPFEDGFFDGVYSVAFLMHLRETAIEGVLREAARVLVAAGVLLFTVCTTRPELAADGTDPGGRFFNIMPAERWRSLVSAAGFAVEDAGARADRLGRDGIRWCTFAGRRPR